VLGIDPGLSGGIAFLGDNFPPRAVDMPVLTVKGAKTKRVIDAAALTALLKTLPTDTQAVVEDVHAMPGQGVVSVFSFGKGAGIVIGVLAALGIPYTEISPTTWKKAVMRGMGREKEAAILRASQLFPHAGVGKKDGRAEALLLAWYWKTQVTGGSL